ncbi:M15 family metallopeptidase [Enemella evansiae]|nr:M15 family metallopeptidase [Enemella evansiae]
MSTRTPALALTGSVIGLTMTVGLTGPAIAAPTPSPTPTPTATPTPSASPGRTPSATPTTTPPSVAPTRSLTPSPTPSASPTPTPAPGPTASPEPAQTRAADEFVVKGEILKRYNELGGEQGQLGKPTSNEFVAGRNVTVQRFQGGNIYWRSDVGATHLVGDILRKYGEIGWENGFADIPVAGEFKGNDGRSYLNWFRNDTTIIWNPGTGAHVVRGSIRQKWHAEGAEGGFGVPTTDEFAGNDGGRSRLSFFRRNAGGDATIIWTPQTGAHKVYGSIRERWHSLGAEGGVLGAPTSDEFDGQRGTRVQRFEKGLLIWSPATGAQPVVGALLADYERRGWEGGDLGAPTSGEWRFVDGWGQDFQNGRLLFLDNGSYRTQVRVNAFVRQAGPGDVQSTFRAGCPVGPDQLRVVEMNYLNYDGRIGRGMMVLRWDAVEPTVRAFSGAAWDSFQIFQMRNPDVWGNDPDQMYANNTSGFFCRSVVGNPYSMSPHSYGRTIDINTVQNPYYDGSRWWPSNGTPWIDRNRRDPGMLFDGGLMTRNLTDNGYFWGGWWADRDYQHFEMR